MQVAVSETHGCVRDEAGRLVAGPSRGFFSFKSQLLSDKNVNFWFASPPSLQGLLRRARVQVAVSETHGCVRDEAGEVACSMIAGLEVPA